MISNQLLERLSKYAPSSAITQAENFFTELFVYLLEYSYEQKIDYWKYFIKLLTNQLPNDNDIFEITTQKIFKLPKIVKPDIVIKYKQQIIIIEVKLDSQLNKYVYKNKRIDQIELYQHIPNINSIFVIEKRFNNTKSLEENKHISWYKLGEISKKSKSSDPVWDYLIKCFLFLLERNGIMAAKISKGIVSGINEIKNLMVNISVSLDEYKCTYTPFTDPTSWFGYNIKKGNKVIAWVGLSVNNPEYIWFELADDIIIHKTRNKNSHFRDIDLNDLGLKFASDFIIDSDFYQKDEESQKNVIQHWIKQCLTDIKYGEFA
jgi:hypothetical protein